MCIIHARQVIYNQSDIVCYKFFIEEDDVVRGLYQPFVFRIGEREEAMLKDVWKCGELMQFNGITVEGESSVKCGLRVNSGVFHSFTSYNVASLFRKDYVCGGHAFLYIDMPIIKCRKCIIPKDSKVIFRGYTEMDDFDYESYASSEIIVTNEIVNF